jgi:hypothetical protein
MLARSRAAVVVSVGVLPPTALSAAGGASAMAPAGHSPYTLGAGGEGAAPAQPAAREDPCIVPHAGSPGGAGCGARVLGAGPRQGSGKQRCACTAMQ